MCMCIWESLKIVSFYRSIGTVRKNEVLYYISNFLFDPVVLYIEILMQCYKNIFTRQILEGAFQTANPTFAGPTNSINNAQCNLYNNYKY
jgi:hypothetical protein